MQPGYPPPAPYPYAPPPQRGGGFPTWAWVLILSLGAVVVLGVAIVLLAVVGVQSYATKSKTVEATNSVGQISRSAVSAYEAEDYVTGAPTHHLCPSASHPVPGSITMVRGVKYTSSSLDWLDGSGIGWDCLKFEMIAPQYYQYDYHATGKGTSVGDRFTAEARGDLDGDGKTSHFSMDGEVSASKRLDLAPTVTVTDEKE